MLYNIKKISLTSKLLVLLSVALTALIYFMAYTATGLGWMLNTSLDDPSASITISSVSNEIGGSTTFKDLEYTSDFAEISIKRVTMQWNPLSIFSNQVIIDNLAGEQLSVNFKSRPADNALLAKLAFPKATNILSASIKNMVIKSNGKKIYGVSDTAIDNIYLDDSFFADKITIKSPGGQWVKFSGQFGFSANSVINLTTEFLFTVPGKNTSIRANGTLVGNAAQMRFLQQVHSPFSADVTGRIRHLFTDPSWVLDTKLSAIDLSALTEDRFLKNVTGEISISGNWRKFEIHSNLLLKDKIENDWTANFVALSNKNILEFELAVNANKARSSRLNSRAVFSGSYNLNSFLEISDQIQGLKIKGNWSGISLPLNNNNTIVANSGSLEFDGASYTSEINVEGVELNTLGPTLTKLALITHKDGNGELIFNGVATSPDGKLNLSGSMVKGDRGFELDNLFLSGNNFTLMRKPQAHIIVSPKLSFIRKDAVMTSTGTITVPTANIQLQHFKQTLAAISSIASSSSKPFGSTGYIDVKFGKAVWLHGFGLNAHVTGDLSLLDMSNKQLVASGELNVLRGNYRSLDQQHKLSGGRLKFNKHDLDNPELDLKVKKRNSETAYASKIIGRLQKLFHDSNSAKNSGPTSENTTKTPAEKIVALYGNH